MTIRRVENWSALQGASAVIRQHGRFVCAGVVDCVTPDGLILWVLPKPGTRRLFDQRESHEAWVEAIPEYWHLWNNTYR